MVALPCVPRRKSSRDAAIACRTAVLVFLSALDSTVPTIGGSSAADTEDIADADGNQKLRRILSVARHGGEGNTVDEMHEKVSHLLLRENCASGELSTIVHLILRNLLPRSKLMIAAQELAREDKTAFAKASSESSVSAYYADKKAKGFGITSVSFLGKNSTQSSC